MARIVNLAGGVGLGVVLSQFPEYVQQYEQRLGGAVDELRVIVTDFDAAAAREGLNRAEALQRYEINPDTFIVGRGADMDKTIARYERLRGQLAELEAAGPVERLTVIAGGLDPDIAGRAYEAFKPAVPVTAEGFGYAGLGLLGGYALLALLGRGFGGMFRRRSPRRA